MISHWYNHIESVHCCYRQLGDSWAIRLRPNSPILVILESPRHNEILLNRDATGATGSNMCVLFEFLRERIHCLSQNEKPSAFLTRLEEDDFCYKEVSVINVADRMLNRKDQAKINRKGEWHSFSAEIADRLHKVSDLRKNNPTLVLSCGSLAHNITETVQQIIECACIVEVYHPSDSGIMHVGCGNKILNIFMLSRYIIKCMMDWKENTIVCRRKELDGFVADKRRQKQFENQLNELLGSEVLKLFSKE